MVVVGGGGDLMTKEIRSLSIKLQYYAFNIYLDGVITEVYTRAEGSGVNLVGGEWSRIVVSGSVCR